jgi:hypothetical protein
MESMKRGVGRGSNCPFSLYFKDEMKRITRIPCIFGSIEGFGFVCQDKVGPAPNCTQQFDAGYSEIVFGHE